MDPIQLVVRPHREVAMGLVMTEPPLSGGARVR
jgi:hypothetical protein